MSDSDHIFETRALGIERGALSLCHDLNIALNPGELQVVRGTNGSGKSTLLRVLAGLRKPQTGAVLWNGAPITKHAYYPQLLCYVGHQHGMRLEMSIADNLKFFAKMVGGAALYDAALHYFDLAPIAHLPASQLSAGWLQRLKLAKLICSPASLWLLDEPTSNLDQRGVELLLSLISTRLERGGLIIMASHAKIEGIAAKELTLGAVLEEESS